VQRKTRKNKIRILILTNEHLYSNLVLKGIIKKYYEQIVGIIEPDFIVFGKTFLGSIIFLSKKSILSFCIYKFFEEKLYSFKMFLGLGNLRSFRSYSRKYRIPLYKTKNINCKKTISLIRHLRPDIIYSIAFPQRIGEQVINVPKHGCINFHDSLLPSYRGLCAYFWIMTDNQKESGISAHFIDKDLDTGKIILQKKFKIGNKETMQHLYCTSSKLNGEALLEIQDKLENSLVRPFSQNKGEPSYYSWPDKAGYKKFKKYKKKFFRFRELWSSI